MLTSARALGALFLLAFAAYGGGWAAVPGGLFEVALGLTWLFRGFTRTPVLTTSAVA